MMSWNGHTSMGQSIPKNYSQFQKTKCFFANSAKLGENTLQNTIIVTQKRNVLLDSLKSLLRGSGILLPFEFCEHINKRSDVQLRATPFICG